MSEKTSQQTSNLTKSRETKYDEVAEDVDAFEQQPSDGDDKHEHEELENKISSESSNYLDSQKKMANILAENIAKEAKLKASQIISKNERIQQEFDGVGKNVEENQTGEYATYDANNEARHEGVETEEERNENAEPLSQEDIKKKILCGAKPVMPLNDAELMKKLKEKYNKLSNQ